MKIFRAYQQSAAGEITWAAWIEADNQAAASARAGDMGRQGPLTVELWTVSRPRPDDRDLEAV